MKPWPASTSPSKHSLPRPRRRAGLGHQHVATEADHAENTVGRAVHDGAVDVGGEYPAIPCDPERTLRPSERLFELARGQQRERAQVVDGWPGRTDVAAGRIEASGERIEQ